MANPTTTTKKRRRAAPDLESGQSAVVTIDEAAVIARLRDAGFDPVPNHQHALTDRIVDSRLDPTCRPDNVREIPVTEHDRVVHRIGLYAGTERIRRTWTFAGDEGTYRFNASWLGSSHAGFQRRWTCPRCGDERWHNLDRLPPGLCWACRGAASMTPQCPEEGVSCATAYVARQCRCAACRAWNAASARRRRAACNNDVITETSNTKANTRDCVVSPVRASIDNIVVTRPETRLAPVLAAIQECQQAQRDPARFSCVACKRRGLRRSELTKTCVGMICRACDENPNVRGSRAAIAQIEESWRRQPVRVVTD